MLTLELLRLIATPEEHIPQIIEYEAKFGETVEKLAQEYLFSGTFPACVPYADGDQRMAAYWLCDSYTKRVGALGNTPAEAHMLQYLFWLHCVPYGRKLYTLLGIDEAVFIASMNDLNYKARECLKVKGHLGVFTNWFFLFFDMKLFALGRLQYELSRYPYDIYTAGGYTLHKGDPVYYCHIPSSGPLAPELVRDSLRQAYAFFKKDLPGTVLPVITHTWLLYPPYQGVTFPAGSNVAKFAELFDIVSVDTTPEFKNCWSVFDMDYPGSTESLPANTGMQRRFIDYINRGGSFGGAYGVLLYDGEKDTIINR